VTTTTVDPAAVAAANTSATGSPVTGTLPVTGSDPRWPSVLALALVGLGSAALAARRRRTTGDR